MPLLLDLALKQQVGEGEKKPSPYKYVCPSPQSIYLFKTKTDCHSY